MNSDKPTLYDRLGGVYAIATVVDDFIDREAEWTAFCKDFDDTMAKFGVPDAEKNELFAIVQSTKGDIATG
jgi:truncated hemoglobin YjbI